MKEEILKRLDALAEKLGVAASYIFKLYVQQAKVEIIQDFTVLGIAVMLIYASVKAMRHGFNSQEDSDIPYIVCGGLGCIVAAIMIITFLFSDVWSAVFNPEFWAFHQILHDLRGQ